MSCVHLEIGEDFKAYNIYFKHFAQVSIAFIFLMQYFFLPSNLSWCAYLPTFFSQTAVGTTEKDLDRQCTFIKEADTCVHNFTKNCLTNDQRSLTGSLFHGAQRLLKEY